jgi:hypothetical protein
VPTNREELLRRLKAAESGLSTREIIEQSSMFVLKGGYACTYNDEVSVKARTGLDKALTGAVKAKPLLDLLEKLPEDEVELAVDGEELIVAGKRRKAGLTLQAEIVLPVDQIEAPETWKPLPADFAEAVQTAARCTAQTTANSEHAVFVHLHPEWAEASDGYQLCRWKLATGLRKPVCVRATSITPACQLGVTEFAETKAWMHLRAKGVVYSLRRYLEDYKDMGPALEPEGSPAVLPKGLAEACERALVLVGENPEEERRVEVDLRPGRVRLKGVGISGWYSESKRLSGYEGKPCRFLISPSMLADIVRNHSECRIGEKRLTCLSNKYTYCAWLFAPNSGTIEEKEEPPDTGEE